MPHSCPSVRRVVSVIALGLVAALFGCGSDGGECTGDVRTVPKVFFGTELPSFVPLDSSQVLAVGDFNGCSGTLITPTWVLTASHCELHRAPNLSFCMGPEPGMPTSCVAVKRVEDHPVAPTVDLTLVELVEDARVVLPEVVPVSIMTEVMDDSWLGRTVEAAGYGETEDGTLGTRYFTAEPIADLTDFVTVDGQGMRGLCFGDSGGPVFVVASNGSVRVAGSLSKGDTSCTGRDHFTRVDLWQDWVESLTGPTSPGDRGCGLFDAAGGCDDGLAMYCAGGELQVETCPQGATCGWHEGQRGFRCVGGGDPCRGFDGRGGCDGNVARWCEGGVPLSRDCSACEGSCNRFATTAGAYCVVDPCMGLDFLGQCEGNVAVWCEDRQIRRLDCSVTGESCQFVDEQVGYSCR